MRRQTSAHRGRRSYPLLALESLEERHCPSIDLLVSGAFDHSVRAPGAVLDLFLTEALQTGRGPARR